MVSFKIRCGDDIRRISIDKDASFRDIVAQLKKLLNVGEDEDLILKYLDDEGDKICLSSELELREALQCCKEPIQIFVVKCAKGADLTKSTLDNIDVAFSTLRIERPAQKPIVDDSKEKLLLLQKMQEEQKRMEQQKQEMLWAKMEQMKALEEKRFQELREEEARRRSLEAAKEAQRLEKQRQEDELKKQQEEEIRKKQEEEMKRKQEEEIKRMLEEEMKKAEEEHAREVKKKQEEAAMKKQEEAAMKKKLEEEEAMRKRAEEERRRRQAEEERLAEEKRLEELARLQKKKEEEKAEEERQKEIQRRAEEERQRQLELARFQEEERKRIEEQKRLEEEAKKREQERVQRRQLNDNGKPKKPEPKSSALWCEYRARNNRTVLLDMSMEGLSKFGVHCYQRVSTPVGPGTVIGVDQEHGFLWFQLDKDKDGISYWDDITSYDTMVCKGIIPQEQTATADNMIPIPKSSQALLDGILNADEKATMTRVIQESLVDQKQMEIKAYYRSLTFK